MDNSQLPNPELLLEHMADALKAHIETKQIANPVMIGIHTGGVWLAESLLQKLGLLTPLGTLDISFYRDDFTRKGLNPSVKPSELPFNIEDSHVILVDDVVMSGRTIRAALNELFDYGRPASVTLVALLELNARELPIRPDIVGATLALAKGQRVKLRGPSPLTLELQELNKNS